VSGGILKPSGCCRPPGVDRGLERGRGGRYLRGGAGCNRWAWRGVAECVVAGCRPRCRRRCRRGAVVLRCAGLQARQVAERPTAKGGHVFFLDGAAAIVGSDNLPSRLSLLSDEARCPPCPLAMPSGNETPIGRESSVLTCLGEHLLDQVASVVGHEDVPRPVHATSVGSSTGGDASWRRQLRGISSTELLLDSTPRRHCPSIHRHTGRAPQRCRRP